MAAVSRLCVLAVVGLAAVGLFADAATAPACVEPAAGRHVYNRSECTGYVECESTMCACMNATYMAPPATCMTGSTADDCDAYLACYEPFQQCVDALASLAGNTSDACYDFALALHTEMLMIADGTPYAGSDLQVSCVYQACVTHIDAPAMPQNCTFLSTWSSVCMAPSPPATPVPSVGTPPPPLNDTTPAPDGEQTPAPDGEQTPAPNETNETTPAPNATSGAAAISTAVLAVVAALAMLL